MANPWLLWVSSLLSLAAPAVAQQEVDEAVAASVEQEYGDEDIALAISSEPWVVVERNNSSGDVWNATWTVRPDGKSFDARWQHTPGGDQGNLVNFAKIKSIQGNAVVISRPGLGEYRGTLSSDRKRITGTMSWCNCSWQVSLPSSAAIGLKPTAKGPASPTGGSPKTSPPSGSAPKTTSVPAPSSVIARSWSVVERKPDTGESWNATWTLRADGRSFDLQWRHSPSGNRGSQANFASIKSLKGNLIVITRPGLGEYRGTISGNRRAISGTTTWCSSCSWEVRLDKPLPSTLPK